MQKNGQARLFYLYQPCGGCNLAVLDRTAETYDKGENNFQQQKPVSSMKEYNIACLV